jgi:universal stress protein E
MQQFRNLLYVSHGLGDETEGLKQALSLARNNGAPLSVLVIAPDLPKSLGDYRSNYDEGMLAKTNAMIDATRSALDIDSGAIAITASVIPAKAPAITIIQHVLQHEIDLVIKESQPRDGASGGFKAVDMDLLRKCPTPVWLCRPISQSRNQIQVAVAVDPEAHDAAAEQLSIKMLKLGRSLADSCSGQLHIVSCWDYEFEAYLRGNAWIKVSEEELQAKVAEVKAEHRVALDALIASAEIGGNTQIHHLHGKADEMIPEAVKNQPIDVLVMGTVARTGIAGFVIGNTAENILQQLSCSLLALKPSGFVSSVKAY